MGQLVQILGALLILAAFVLAQIGVLDQRSDRYLVANLVGASVLALDAWLESQLGFFVLEAAWAIVAGWALATRRRRNPAQSSSTSTNANS
jgi:membrane protein implicated in regulation of membrane protease activity